jgi:hypothetical protein
MGVPTFFGCSGIRQNSDAANDRNTGEFRYQNGNSGEFHYKNVNSGEFRV